MNKELLDKYFSGQCTSEESAEIERWLGTHDALPEQDVPVSAAKGKDIWRVLRKRIHDNGESGRFTRYTQLAAAAAAIVAISTTLYFTLGRTQESITWQTVNNPGGREVKIILPDNSVVQLNGGATLQYPSAFEEHRTVKLLAGEAFFTIDRDEKRPFFVETTGEGRIQVLGTSFNVKPVKKSQLEITLTSGKIKFSAGAESVLLSPGEQLHYVLKAHKLLPVTKADTGMVLSWTSNVLQFRDTPLEEVFETLENRYGITFKIAEKLTPQTLSGKFSSRSLAEILSLIEKTTDVKFKLEEKRVIVTR